MGPLRIKSVVASVRLKASLPTSVEASFILGFLLLQSAFTSHITFSSLPSPVYHSVFPQRVLDVQDTVQLDHLISFKVDKRSLTVAYFPAPQILPCIFFNIVSGHLTYWGSKDVLALRKNIIYTEVVNEK